MSTATERAVSSKARAAITVAAIPAHNEAGRIGHVVRGALKQVDSVIVVDDGSVDGTGREALEAGATVIRLEENRGVGFATREACDRAVALGANVIVTLDGDGQHDPDDIPSLLKELGDTDVVFGSRPRDHNMPVLKRAGNLCLSFLCRRLYGIPTHDSQTGLRAFRPEAYSRLRWCSDGYSVASECVVNSARAGLRYSEVPIKTIYIDKPTGMRAHHAIRAFVDVILWRLRPSLR